MSVLTIERLSDTVGARVEGVDIDQLVNDESLAASILDALEANGVLVFPGLDLPPEAQVAFCKRLGEIDLQPGHHPVSGIYRVSLDKTKNSSAEYLQGTFDWHIDGCTSVAGECPQMATVLSAKAVSASGGETEFASTYAGYDQLSAAEKQQIAGLKVIHSLRASQRRQYPNPTPEQLTRWQARPSSTHPLVWTHHTGRKSLVLGASADYIEGMDEEEGQALLTSLLDRATTPDLVYRHDWSVGDTVIWDNRGVLHRAAPYDAASDREMLRTTILGDEPIQ